MRILQGTNVDETINLSFTREEFDELIECLTIPTLTTSLKDNTVGGALLRFKATFGIRSAVKEFARRMTDDT